MSSWKFYGGLFLITACTLMMQVVQTRILSVVAWYHLAFFAISMAMFGLTAGAVWLYAKRDRFTERTLSYDLAYYATAFAVTIALGLVIQMSVVPIVGRSMTALVTWAELALCLAVPFFFSGVVVSLALTRSPFPIGRVYGVDLLGAAAGCLGVLWLLNLTDGPSAVLWIAVVAAVGAWLFAGSGIGGAPEHRPALDRLFGHRLAVVAVLAALALLNGATYFGFQPLFAKGRFEDGTSYAYRSWNTFSRVTMTHPVIGAPHMWGPSSRMPKDLRVTQQHLNIDGDAGTPAYRFQGDPKEVDFLRYDITTLAYHLPNRTRNAVIGIGGGRDILTAALFGSRDITGVELNPTFVDLLTRGPLADFTRVSTLPGLKLYVDEGRSWFARTDRSFDLIQMSLIDTWAATGAGAFSLSENGLYTVEGWKVFLQRLGPAGAFTVSRWYSPSDPTETGRMLSVAVAALLELGATEPARHLFLATQGPVATLIVTRQPLAAVDLQALERATDDYAFEVLLSPTHRPTVEVLGAIAGATRRVDLDRYTSQQPFDLTPATDDRPFFFNQVPVNKPVQALYVAKALVGHGEFGYAEYSGGVRRGNLVATATLLLLFVVSLVLVVATIVFPLRSALHEVGRTLALAGTCYFLLIGIGFMMVEIGLLQRMSIFLGHPVYSLSVSLFTLIVSTGIGSLVSERMVLDRPARLVLWGAVTFAYILSLPHWLTQVLEQFDSAALATRTAVCVVVIAPAGLLMGFGFPTGMRLVSAIDCRPTPWFWGVNGAAGVLASATAVALSIAAGIGATLALGAACYLLLIPFGIIMLRTRAMPSAILRR